MKKEIEVKLKKANYELFADKNELTGTLDELSIDEYVKLVKQISDNLQSSKFDKIIYEHFKSITDNPCACCEQCNKQD